MFKRKKNEPESGHGLVLFGRDGRLQESPELNKVDANRQTIGPMNTEESSASNLKKPKTPKDYVIYALAIVGVLLLTYAGIWLWASKEAKTRVDLALAKVSLFLKIEYEKVKLDPFSWDVSIHRITLSPAIGAPLGTIDQIVIQKIRGAEGIPSRLSMVAEKIDLRASSAGPELGFLRGMGYESLQMEFELQYQYGDGNDDFVLEKAKIGIKDAGDLSVSLHLGNVFLEPELMADMGTNLPLIKFHRAELSYTDHSLVDRLFRYFSDQKKIMSPKMLKTQVLNNLRENQRKATDSFDRNGIAAMIRFLQKPGKIALVAKPNEPILLGDLEKADESELFSLLNMQITTQ